VGQPVISHHYRACQSVNLANNMCFEVLGFDIMLDEKGTPFLLEINHSPSFHTDTALDLALKEALIADTLRLANISPEARN
jgi:tubulin polyglutamylase TTLL6/13